MKTKYASSHFAIKILIILKIEQGNYCNEKSPCLI